MSEVCNLLKFNFGRNIYNMYVHTITLINFGNLLHEFIFSLSFYMTFYKFTAIQKLKIQINNKNIF